MSTPIEELCKGFPGRKRYFWNRKILVAAWSIPFQLNLQRICLIVVHYVLTINQTIRMYLFYRKLLAMRKFFLFIHIFQLLKTIIS